jgi:hypothetical protein
MPGDLGNCLVLFARPMAALCHYGSASALATQQHQKKGLAHVRKVRGGIRSPKTKCLPLEHPAATTMRPCHCSCREASGPCLGPDLGRHEATGGDRAGSGGEPAVLVLDEPFGALDAITKEELQEELLAIWRENKPTVLMITHDIDEALFLADRIVMMTNGPSATIGDILTVPFERPAATNASRPIPATGRYGMRRWTFCIGGMRMRWIEGELSG